MKALICIIGMLTVLLSPSCDKGETNYNSDIKLHKNQPVKVSGTESIFLEAIEITDSRCPKDVVCVWEGNAMATIRISSDDAIIAVPELCLGSCSANGKSSATKFTINGETYELILKDVSVNTNKPFAIVQVKKT